MSSILQAYAEGLKLALITQPGIISTVTSHINYNYWVLSYYRGEMAEVSNLLGRIYITLKHVRTFNIKTNSIVDHPYDDPYLIDNLQVFLDGIK